MISIMLAGEAFSRSVAVAPKRSGNIAKSAKSEGEGNGGEPTNTSSGVTPENFLARSRRR